MDGLVRYGGWSLEYSLCSLGSPGASYFSRTLDRSLNTSLEQRVRSFSRVDDTLGLITLLRQILVLDPVRRPDVSDFVDDPWFVDSSSPLIPSSPSSSSGSELE